MWRCRHNAYRADGAFGQFIIVMPDQDAVIVFTAETPSMQEEINLVWQNLLPFIKAKKLPVNKSKAAMLKQKLSSLSLPLPAKRTAATNILTKTFSMEPNEKHIKSLSFNFQDNICSVNLEADTTRYQLNFGNGMWQAGETTMHGPSLVATAKASFVGLPPLKIDGAYTWTDENTLELVLRYIESPHTEKMICHFEEKNIFLVIENSFEYGKKKMQLKGVSTE
jgi:hypothetical protein